ncbi:MAG: EamA family transporter [Acidimicrobiaceae bacterium]|nr:EamA family transporter [Acidimicrobiaceae bacterium]MYE98518.1 EamA family transporter [Acidimicrobiaceae bacterium]MYH44542.1 EamA family transporter [Acidimicrobiaceae bacterium]MYI54021.1 EamA family transporter [Acidimicrobiaceae bacterium]
MIEHDLRRDRSSTVWGVGATALATSLIGTIGTAAELGPDSLDPVATGAWRGGIGALGLLVLTTLRGQAPWRYRLPVRWVALGAMGVAVSQLLFFEAMARTGVAVGTLVAIGVGPLAAGLMDWVAHGQRPDRHWLAGMVAAIAGVALLSGGAAEVVWSGVGLAVLAGCGIPCQGFAAQQLMRDRPLVTAMATVLSGGAVLMLPVTATSVDTTFDSMASTSTVLYLGLVTVMLAHSLWGAGLKRLTLSVAVVVGLLEPAVAATLAMTVLSEPVTVALIVGICMVIAGVAITSLSPVAGRTG